MRAAPVWESAALCSRHATSPSSTLPRFTALTNLVLFLDAGPVPALADAAPLIMPRVELFLIADDRPVTIETIKFAAGCQFSQSCDFQVAFTGGLAPEFVAVLSPVFDAHPRGEFRFGTGLCDMPTDSPIFKHQAREVEFYDGVPPAQLLLGAEHLSKIIRLTSSATVEWFAALWTVLDALLESEKVFSTNLLMKPESSWASKLKKVKGFSLDHLAEVKAKLASYQVPLQTKGITLILYDGLC
jgi:hypothetical protein